MALSRKGLRNIHVDGRDFLWTMRRRGVRGCPDCDTLSVLVCRPDRGPGVLRFSLREAWREDRPVTPRHVAEVIRVALADGWEPRSQEDPQLSAEAVQEMDRIVDNRPAQQRACEHA